MNKGFMKISAAMVLSSFLITSTVSYAGEIELNSGNEIYNQSSEIFETKDISWVEPVLIVRDSEDMYTPVREITKEQLAQEVKEEKIPWMASVVFELTEEGKEVAEEYQNMKQSTGSDEESFEVEKPEAIDTLYGDVPSVSLTEDQVQMVVEIANMVPQTVVMFNKCVPENNMLFQDIEAVKAVTSIEASDENEVYEKVSSFDLEQEYMNYLQLQAISEDAFELRSSSTGESNMENSTDKPALNGSGDNNSSTESTASNESETTSSSENTSTAVKDVTLTLVPDEVLEEDDYLSATYQIKTEKEITSLKGTLTYDVSLMTYDVIENSEDAIENDSEDAEYGFKILKSPNDNNGQAGTVEFEFKLKTPKKLNGDLIDVYFDLLSPAKVGQEYSLDLKVDEVKYNTTTLTSEVVSQKFVAIADPDLQTESESQTQQTETIQSEASSTEAPDATIPVNAPKTGDETNVAVLFMAVVCAVFVFEKARKKV